MSTLSYIRKSERVFMGDSSHRGALVIRSRRRRLDKLPAQPGNRARNPCHPESKLQHLNRAKQPIGIDRAEFGTLLKNRGSPRHTTEAGGE